jgi:hypothetical protein
MVRGAIFRVRIIDGETVGVKGQRARSEVGAEIVAGSLGERFDSRRASENRYPLSRGRLRLVA